MPWRGKSAALCQAESLTYFRVQQRARIACRRTTAGCAARTADAPLEGCGCGCASEPRRSGPTTGISAPAEERIPRVSRN